MGILWVACVSLDQLCATVTSSYPSLSLQHWHPNAATARQSSHRLHEQQAHTQSKVSKHNVNNHISLSETASCSPPSHPRPPSSPFPPVWFWRRPPSHSIHKYPSSLSGRVSALRPSCAIWYFRCTYQRIHAQQLSQKSVCVSGVCVHLVHVGAVCRAQHLIATI